MVSLSKSQSRLGGFSVELCIIFCQVSIFMSILHSAGQLAAYNANFQAVSAGTNHPDSSTQSVEHDNIGPIDWYYIVNFGELVQFWAPKIVIFTCTNKAFKSLTDMCICFRQCPGKCRSHGLPPNLMKLTFYKLITDWVLLILRVSFYDNNCIHEVMPVIPRMNSAILFSQFCPEGKIHRGQQTQSLFSVLVQKIRFREAKEFFTNKCILAAYDWEQLNLEAAGRLTSWGPFEPSHHKSCPNPAFQPRNWLEFI